MNIDEFRYHHAFTVLLSSLRLLRKNTLRPIPDLTFIHQFSPHHPPSSLFVTPIRQHRSTPHHQLSPHHPSSFPIIPDRYLHLSITFPFPPLTLTSPLPLRCRALPPFISIPPLLATKAHPTISRHPPPYTWSFNDFFQRKWTPADPPYRPPQVLRLLTAKLCRNHVLSRHRDLKFSLIPL